MLIPTKDRLLILEYLFREGVLVAKKDFTIKKHSDALPVKNLYAVKALQSLKSKGLVKEQFNWQYYYFFLNDDGVAYLRNYLHKGENDVPVTHKKPPSSRQPTFINEREGGDRGDRRGPRGDRGDRRDRGDRGDRRGDRGDRGDKKVTPGSGEIGFVSFPFISFKKTLNSFYIIN